MSGLAAASAQGQIAFTSNRDGNNEIYVMNTDGTGVTRLTHDSANDQDPAWSPDGARLAFMSTRGGNYDIYVMNADGSGVTRLTVDPGRDQRPAWCGTKIAFDSDRNGIGFPDIYVMNDDGTGVTGLTLGGAALDEYATWSPSCDQIAYSADPYGSAASIRVMNADGSGNRLLVSGPGHNSFAAWSPDGKRIAFSSDRDTPGNSSEVYVTNADGTQQTRLTVRADYHTYTLPAWSSDGTQIAFDVYGGLTALGTYVMRGDGSGVVQLSDGVAGTRPAWFGPGAPPPPPAPVHVADLDASAATDGSTWTARIVIAVHDAAHNPRPGIAVTGSWSVGEPTTTCITDNVGTCAVVSSNLRKNARAVTFAVTGMQAANWGYDPPRNHDPDGDSNGTSITVSRQQFPPLLF